MTELGWFLFVAAIVITAAVVWSVQHMRDERFAVRARVLVNLLDGKALDGVLWARRGRWLVLRDVTLIEPGTPPVKVDGEILVDRGRVDFIQAVGGR